MSFIQSETSTNLATHTVIIPTTDVYSFQGTLTLPNIVPTPTPGAGGGAGTGANPAITQQVNSQVVVTINQNGTPILTTQAGARGFYLPAVSCTAGDVITFVRTSSLSQDEQLNAIRMTLAISEGAL